MLKYYLVWDILVKYAGALERDRYKFLDKVQEWELTKDIWFRYVFNGDLSSGVIVLTKPGKSWVEFNPKDLTKERIRIGEEVNNLLGYIRI
jgi:hypothetical protein